MFDLLNITVRNIKTKTKKLSIKNVQFHLIPSYPYLQVLHTLKLYSQFEEESTKLIMLVCFPCRMREMFSDMPFMYSIVVVVVGVALL